MRRRVERFSAVNAADWLDIVVMTNCWPAFAGEATLIGYLDFGSATLSSFFLQRIHSGESRVRRLNPAQNCPGQRAKSITGDEPLEEKQI